MTSTEMFATLYAAHSEQVRRVILAGLRAGDAHQVDDLAQEVWLALWRRLDRGDAVRRPAGLLAVMARHRVVDHYRSAYVRREVATDTTVYGVFDRAAAREAVAA